MQDFHVLKCYECEKFQVHIVRKDNKFVCKICHAKQSVKKVYGKGTAKDCRQHVQKLNSYVADLDQQMCNVSGLDIQCTSYINEDNLQNNYGESISTTNNIDGIIDDKEQFQESGKPYYTKFLLENQGSKMPVSVIDSSSTSFERNRNVQAISHCIKRDIGGVGLQQEIEIDSQNNTDDSHEVSLNQCKTHPLINDAPQTIKSVHTTILSSPEEGTSVMNKNIDKAFIKYSNFSDIDDFF